MERPRRTMAKQAETTVRRFEVGVNNGAELTGPVIGLMDTAFCLSKLNHRLYRQGRQYRLRVDATRDSFYGSESIGVWALMPTWYLRSAWRMAKKSYDTALADEMEALSEGNLARWRDFRIGSGITLPGLPASDALEFGGVPPTNWSLSGTVTSPNDTPTDFTTGEYNLSYAHNLETGVNMKFRLTGGDANWFGIFEEYSKSRNESASPETVIAEMPYEDLMSDANADDYQELQANGNEPPYNATVFPGAVWVKVGTLEKSTDMQRMSTGFFTAPLGMVAFMASDWNGGSTAVAKRVHCTVQEGAYLGVHAPSM